MDSLEQGRHPLDVPLYEALSYPEHLTAPIAAYRHAYGAWRTAYVALLEALQAIPTAQAADRQALTDAVATGKPVPPGTLDKAQAEAVRADELARQTREACNTAADQLKATLDSASEELLPLAAAHVREALADYLTLYTGAKAKLTEARANLRRAVATLTTGRPAVKRAGLGFPDLGTGVPDLQWPIDEPGVQLLLRLARLEADLARLKTSA